MLVNKDDFIKRSLDLTISSLGLMALWPFFVILAVWIKFDSSGPVFYFSERIGRGGNLFRLIKFRTMVDRADQLGGCSTSADDPRITRVGQILRRYKLDELPQLFNVIKGDMSLVGPRPEVAQYVEMFDEQEKAILTLKPGITDWASIWNSDEGAILAKYADPDKAYLELIRPTKVKLQLKYVREKSFGVDLKILYLTVKAIVHKKPALRELE